MIEDFSMNIECELDKIDVNGANDIFIVDILEIYANESVVSDDKVDFEKLDPLILWQLTADYYFVGRKARSAWKVGKELSK